MKNRINMARRVKAVNATFVPVADKAILSTFDTLYYRRQVSEQEVRIVLLFSCRRQ
jgi:hypothetical protein